MRGLPGRVESAGQPDQPGPTGLDRVLAGSGAAIFVVVAAIGLAEGDREALALSALMLGGLALPLVGLRRLGRVVLGVLLVDVGVWMFPAAVSNVANGESFRAVMVPVTLAALCAVGLAALAGLVAGSPGGSPSAVNRAVAGVVAVVAVVAAAALVGGASRSGKSAQAHAGDLVVTARDVAFLPAVLQRAAGPFVLTMTNRDLFWHTFTLPALGVDMKVPVGGTRRVTFEAPPGTYEFVCRVPGHERAGMRGTLVVS